MWPFKDKNYGTIDKILELMKIIELRVSKNEAQIEIINIKLRKKIYKEEVEEEKKESVKYDDGLPRL